MSLSEAEISSYLPAVPSFSVLLGGLSLYMLEHLSGKLSNIDKYVASRNWYFIDQNKDKYQKYKVYFRIIIVTFILSPVILFASWVAALFYNEDYSDGSGILPLSALCIGLCATTFSLSLGFLKWNKYEMNLKTAILLSVGLLAFVTFQTTGNFVGVTERSFFGITAVFLTYNAIIVLFLIFMNAGKHKKTFLEMLMSRATPSTVSTSQVINFQMLDNKDNNYTMTKEEVLHFFTITEEESSLIAGGLPTKFGKLSTSTQTLLNAALYTCALILLAVYAAVVHWAIAEYRLGLVTAIATFTTDTIVLVFYWADVMYSVFQLSLTALVCRVFLFGFGGTYWVYGYCLLYCFLGVIIAANIAAKHFPLSDTLKINSIIGPMVKKNTKCHLIKTPEFLFVYSTFLFLSLTTILHYTRPYGIPLPPLNMLDTEYEFWVFVILSFIFVLAAYFVITIVRIVVRDNQKIADVLTTSSGCSSSGLCNVFWMHSLVCYLIFVGLGVTFLVTAQEAIPLIMSCFFPLIVILMVRIYIYYRRNDYQVLREVKLQDDRMQLARKRSQNVEEEVVEDYSGIEDNKPRVVSPSMVTHEIDKDLKEEPEDWRKDYCVVSAFFRGKLHRNDYQIILNAFAVVALIFIHAAILHVESDSDNPSYAFPLAFMIFDTALVFAGNFKYLATGISLNAWNIVLIALGVIAHIGYGAGHFTKEDKVDLNDGSTITWALLYCVADPGLLALFMGIYRWYENKWNYSRYTFVMLIIFIGFLVFLCFFLAQYVDTFWGIFCFICTIIIGYYVLLGYYRYSKKKAASLNLYVATIGSFILISFSAGMVSEAAEKLLPSQAFP